MFGLCATWHQIGRRWIGRALMTEPVVLCICGHARVPGAVARTTHASATYDLGATAAYDLGAPSTYDLGNGPCAVVRLWPFDAAALALLIDSAPPSVTKRAAAATATATATASGSSSGGGVE